MAIQYDRTAPVLDNTQVDNIAQTTGAIDQLSSLSLDIADSDIIKNLNQRIEDSQAYWNDTKGFDLKNARAKNERFHLGKVSEDGLYRHQKQYRENQVFVAEESIVAYVTAQIAGPLVIPASSENRDKLFAGDLEKAIKCDNEETDLERDVELAVRNILNKRLAAWKLNYDKTTKRIHRESVDPEHLIVDKNAALGANPAFICHVLKRSPEELITQFPDKEKDILAKLGIERRTPKQMTREVAIREVWVTHYDKQNEPQEGVVWYFDDLVLDRLRNPNWLYASEDKNLLEYPEKPFIFGNLINYGNHVIDSTTPLEQAISMQEYLMRRGRQIGENADKANGLLVISTESGLSKDDGQNLTGDPNQKLFVDTSSGKNVEQLVHQIQAQQLPQYVMDDKLDARTQIGNIMAAPTDFTGSQADDGDPTLGEVMIKKNQAAGRQDLMVRAVTRMLRHYYKYWVQMCIVWYDESRSYTYDSGDGEFDYITLKRDLIPHGIRVKAAKPANPDTSRQEAIAIKLLEQKAISLLDAYKILKLDNPQQLYDNWAKQNADPNSLAREALDTIDEADAYVAFTDIMAGKPVEVKENPSKEYILSLRKLMINDQFLKAPKGRQNAFIKYVNKCLDSLEMRMALDEASDVSPEGERPGSPLPQQAATQIMSGAPMQPGMGPASMLGAPMQPGMPPMGAPMSPTPTPNSVFAGTPVPAPGQAPMPQPTNPAGLPMA